MNREQINNFLCRWSSVIADATLAVVAVIIGIIAIVNAIH